MPAKAVRAVKSSRKSAAKLRTMAERMSPTGHFIAEQFSAEVEWARG
jgi:hypothetical protein